MAHAERERKQHPRQTPEQAERSMEGLTPMGQTDITQPGGENPEPTTEGFTPQARTDRSIPDTKKGQTAKK